MARFYFAYGSCISGRDEGLADLMDSGKLRFVGPAFFLDAVLVFNFYSGKRKGGAANIQSLGRPDGKAVPGTLFEVEDEALQYLDIREGHPSVYRRTDIVITTVDGRKVNGFTYIVTKERREKDHVPPAETYASIVRNGLLEYGLPTEMLEESIERFVETDNIRRVFVYGTLMQGQLRANSMILNGEKPEAEKAYVFGKLLNLSSSFPGLIWDEKSEANDEERSKVFGELYTYDAEYGSLGQLLRELDGIEGHSPDGFGLFHRFVTKVFVNADTTGSTRTEYAFTYLFNQTSLFKTEEIPSGNWRDIVP